MNRHYPPGADEFAELVRHAEQFAWRLETLQQYGGSGEDDALQAFLAGEPYRASVGKTWWLDTIRVIRERGASVGRVHVVTEGPELTDYMRYELQWGYGPNVEAGEDIRILLSDGWDSWFSEWSTHQDFWCVDGELYVMHYAWDGMWLDVEHVTAPDAVAAALDTKQEAISRAMPYEQYMRHARLVAAA